MGHKVNPLVFRLGISNNWAYSFKEPKNWITSYLIYQLVSNQFMKYTIPHFNKAKKRNTRNAQGLVRMRGEKQIIANPLMRRSILFSHLNVGSRNSEVFVSCYFYDYGVHYKRYKYRFKKFLKYNQLFSNSPLKKYIRHPYWRKQIKHRNYPWMFKKWISKMGPQLWLYNYRIRNAVFSAPDKSFKLNLCWLRLATKLKYLNHSKKIFFINVWINLLTGIFPILRTTGFKNLTRRIYLMIQLLNFVNYSLKVNNCQFFSHLFVYRYYLFKAVSRTINSSIRSMLDASRVRTAFHAVREKQMRSSLMTNLIIVKLGQYYTINSIIFPVAKWLKRHKNVLGFRIIVSGRLTRRERASHIIQSYKKMPLSSYKYSIDYHQDIKIMKFGMVGIKVYLFVRKKNRNNYYWMKFLHIA